ncbi:MAG TPA: transcription-repair coupling factor [Candidatus Krumholzibacteria bacterium]|nr:transcription-repair coupling factor [Candidatus Krumholzibacteria bacterium]
MIEQVRRLPLTHSLRAAIEEASRAARALSEAEAGRAIDKPRGTYADKLEARHRVHLSGLKGSSSVFLAEAIRQSLNRSVLLVYPDEESAQDAASDLRTVSTGHVVHFPERTLAPHRFELRENLVAGGDRNESLLTILNGGADVVVTSVLGLLEKTITTQSLSAHRRTLSQGDTVDLDMLREHFVDMGYDAVSVVEEAGQFAVRGSILDVFDPAWDYPARVELEDDEIVSIRSFDLDTQRSVEALQTCTVLPASSTPIDEAGGAHLRAFLKERGFDDDLIERIADEAEHSRSSYVWRRYAPALGMTGALLDFFPEPPVVWFVGGEAINRALASMATHFARVAQRAEDEFPALALEDYVHGIDHVRVHGAPVVIEWALSDSAIAASPSDVESDGIPPARDDETALKFLVSEHPSVVGKLDPLIGRIKTLRARHVDVLIYSETPTQRERLADLLGDDEALVHLPVGWIASGFIWEQASIAILTDHQIFNRMLARPKKRRAKRRTATLKQEALQSGDYVVHVEYGIGRFVGLEKIGADGTETECLAIRFDGDDRIFVPLDQMQLVEKYVGREGVIPRLDKLGGTRWENTKAKARKAIEDIARDLLHVYAQREIARAHAFGPDTAWQRELEASFPYEETPHQISVTREIKDDLETDQPMERLVCGDVGFGKTEVAIRAAFKAVTGGKQVAVLVPTTLLAFQHERTFKERMQGFPVRIAMLSRFVSPSEQKKVLEGVRDGTVDLVIGTHRLLSKDLMFKDLGLLIVDEEHRFGVKHKERLKQIAQSVHVLTLTATPIPRTLYMSLSGLRKISLIETPPRNRHPVKTEVTAFDETTIHDAISEEISRDGQVFFVHNRVQSIHSMKQFLERLVPGVRFGVAHGQMGENELEDVVLAFIDRKYDVLISTMIIESGLDIPNVNTLIVNRADRFGLAQLYQLRGRVGRRERQAYAYFLVPRQISLTPAAMKRLQAMEEFEELGSGYRLAMRDLEIRGAGNVLGVEQHGHVAAVGFELYTRMLKETVDQLRGAPQNEVPPCRVEAPYSCFIPDRYVPDADERMLIYKRIAHMSEPAQVQALEDELKDRFGEIPRPARDLIELARIKLEAQALGVLMVHMRDPNSGRTSARTQGGAVGRGAFSRDPGTLPAGEATLEFAPGKALTPQACARLSETFGRRILFKSGKSFAVNLRGQPPERVLDDVNNLLQVARFASKINALPRR